MIEKTKRSTDRTLRAIQQDMEQENTLVSDTPNTRLQKVLKIYCGIKPVLALACSRPAPSDIAARSSAVPQLLSSDRSFRLFLRRERLLSGAFQLPRPICVSSQRIDEGLRRYDRRIEKALCHQRHEEST